MAITMQESVEAYSLVPPSEVSFKLRNLSVGVVKTLEAINISNYAR